jgi:hypothetical protein
MDSTRAGNTPVARQQTFMPVFTPGDAVVCASRGHVDRGNLRSEGSSDKWVAGRLVLEGSEADAKGAALGVSSASVTARRGLTTGRAEKSLRARDCLTHAAEVHRLLDSR